MRRRTADDELEASGAGQVLDRYLIAIERLQQAGWRRILLSTDHGYMHWSGTAEQAAPAPEGTPVYACRRALAFAADDLPGSFPHAPGGAYRVALAAGASTFKTYGGMGYYHGGGSLQEWVIPCFHAEWPAAAKPVELAIRPVKAILSPKPRIVLEVSRASLLVEESLGRSVTAAIRNVTTNERLFRAGELLVTPDRVTVEIGLTRTSAVAPRGTVLRIEVCDALTDAVLASAESILMFEIDPWDSEPS